MDYSQYVVSLFSVAVRTWLCTSDSGSLREDDIVLLECHTWPRLYCV